MADFEAAPLFQDVLSELVAGNGFTLEQNYNACETRLMWKFLPNSTLVSGNEKISHKFRLNKKHISVLISVNSLGNHTVKLCDGKIC